MTRTARRLGLLAGGFALVAFGVVVVNQTAQVVQLANAVSPTLGTATLWGLVGTYAVLLGTPAVMFWRLPRPLIPPERPDGPEFEAHLERLAGRIGASPHLAGRDLSGRAGVEAGLAVLDARADALVREAAASVFLATAVSQSGRLDGLLVLMAQSRMVWRVAHLYHQRPSARDMIRLYANVAGTAFVAGELQEIDLGTQVEPILSAAVGSLGANVPGFHVAGTVLANCVLSGSANAFLTLRVGMIAKRSCGALTVQPRATLRRLATAEAAGHLGSIVADGTARLTKAVWHASVGKVGDAVAGVSGYARDAGAKLLARVRPGRKEQGAEVL